MVQQELTSAFQVKPVTNLLPINIEETIVRLDLIEIVRNKMAYLKPDRPLNHIQFCYLVGMPLGDLRAFAYSGPGHVVKTIRGLEKLTAYFFKSQEYFIPFPPATPSTRSQGPLCTELDRHRCIVTGLSDPQVCYIVPFAWNQTQEHLEKTRRVLGKVDYFIFEKTAEASETNMEIIKGVRSSDMPWNVLRLSPQLHTWWGKAYFGFKYYDTVLCEDDPNYSIISLQFVWMPCNVKALAKEQVDLAAQRDPLTALGVHLTHRYGDGPLSACTTRNCTKCRETLGVQCHDISSNRPVESGTIVKVRRLTKHRGLLEHVIKLQWSVICAAAMSGGAQIYEDELLSDSEDSPCGSVPEQQDLEESEEELKEAGENARQASIEKVDSWLQQWEPADEWGPARNGSRVTARLYATDRRLTVGFAANQGPGSFPSRMEIVNIWQAVKPCMQEVCSEMSTCLDDVIYRVLRMPTTIPDQSYQRTHDHLQESANVMPARLKEIGQELPALREQLRPLLSTDFIRTQAGVEIWLSTQPKLYRAIRAATAEWLMACVSTDEAMVA
ncbi:sulfate adenylyltransferase subunit 2 [Fusarium circinatum]|uniref:Sulfate adenylyltransferase subunit 2 n=1 Tax=Fusarium circinatum TaxID=48490 RepID=A0A8H5X540_FUSCI|nr:sulfate adenylyltransferase subunit 2 [Fusarium circinatum]